VKLGTGVYVDVGLTVDVSTVVDEGSISVTGTGLADRAQPDAAMANSAINTARFKRSRRGCRSIAGLIR